MYYIYIYITCYIPNVARIWEGGLETAPTESLIGLRELREGVI
jgi:hypothetical protein